MNFQPASGCDAALSILKPLGLPLRVKQELEQTRPPAQRPYSAQSILTTSPPRSQESKRPVTASCDEVLSSVTPLEVASRPMPFDNQDPFSKPISYIHDPRNQLQRATSNNTAAYGYHPAQRQSLPSTSSGCPDQARMMPPTLRTLLPSPGFVNESSYFTKHDNRPVSAPEPNLASCLDDIVPITQMLPPVRELPFPEKPAYQDTHTVPESCNTQSLDSQLNQRSPQPQPKKKRAAAKPRVKKAALSESTSGKAPPSNAPSNVLSKNPYPNQNRAEEVFLSSAPSNIGTLEELENTIPKPSRGVTPPSSRGGTEASKKRPLSAVEDNESNKRQNRVSDIAPLPVTLQAATQAVNPILSNISPAEYVDSLEGWVRIHQDLPVSMSPANAKDQFAEYASKSDEERAKIIDNMICECLQDENFGKFADDVEGHWKRICLGS